MNFDQDLTEIYSFLLDRTFRTMKQAAKRQLRELQADVTIEQFATLKRLDELGDMSQTELAANSFKDAPTLTRIIDLLCEKGFTERKADPNDRRRFIIHLTKAGKKKVDDLLPHILAARKQGWEGLTEKDLADLKRILIKIEENFS